MRHWFAYHPRFFTLLTIVVGVVASLLGYWGSAGIADENLRRELQSRVVIRENALRESLRGYEDTVRSLAMLYLASDEVTREEFALASKGLLTRRAGIQAIQWAPVIPGHARAEHERRASAELGLPYVITERDQDGRIHAAAIRSEYWPITFNEPLAGNEAALGYDTAVGPNRAVLDRARETGRMQVTPRFDLIQTEPGDNGVILVAPVDDEDGFVGWVQGVFRLADMLKSIAPSPELRSVNVVYLDLSEPRDDPAHILFWDVADDLRMTGMSLEEIRRGWHGSFVVDFGGRQWEVLARPSPAWLKANRSMMPGVLVVGGLLLTFLAALVVDILARRAQWGRRLVAERTLELSESRRRLQEILDFSPVAIFVKDREHRYVQVNPGLARLFGKNAEEILGRSDTDLFNATDAQFIRDTDDRALAGRDVIEYELHAQIDGHEIWCIVNKFPLTDGHGRLVGVCGIATDIRGLKEAESGKLQAERRLQVRQRLEGLAVLAGGIAHDLNNVLAPILLTVDILKSTTDDEQSRELLDSIGQSARRGAGLVRQVLAFARGTEGNRETVDLRELMAEIGRHTRDSAPNGLKVFVDLPADPARVSADRDQLHRAVLNLIVNARDSMPEGGELRLEVECVEADALFVSNLPELAVGRYHTIGVTDTGNGIDSAVRDRIFEPFFTTKAPGRGTGLGLAMVDAIVRAHHGAVTVYSESGRGTTFRLYLPADVNQAGAAAMEELVPPRGSGQMILVVDDEPAIRAASRRTLEAAGYRVVVAAHGREALDVLVSHPEVVLVLTDLVMEGMDGAQLLEVLEGLHPDLPVLITSGFPATDRVAKALEERRWRFLPKPATANQLLRAIAETLNGGR